MATASAASTGGYCICGGAQPDQDQEHSHFMIECDICREWFHGSCVGIKVYQSEDIDKFHCPKCATSYGPSIYKIETNDHRNDKYEINADRKPMQSGTRAFIRHLLQRVFPPDKHYIVMEPKHLTESFLREQGFSHPLLFETSHGLDLKVPQATTFNVKSVERHCGSSRELDVIESLKQSNCKMTLGEFVEYFLNPDRSKILNVLSFEFSSTHMSMFIQPPLIARDLDWVKLVWPHSGTTRNPIPVVQKYCIMSAAGSYTDFHIDFGGSSVWYHVMHGQKIFYMIPPTQNNLALYQQWLSSENHSEVFLGDLTDSCTPCVLKRGQTLFIPTGWIHAVYTPEDSLVFGGNFLHSLNIELQLQINEIEKATITPMMYRFPSFETIHWYAGAHFLQHLRRVNEEQQDKDFTITETGEEGYETPTKSILDLPPYLLRGIRALTETLKNWNCSKSFDPIRKDYIPESINSGQLVRDLARELRKVERVLPLSLGILGSTSKKKKKRTKSQDISPLELSVSSSPFDISNSRGQQGSKKSLKLILPKSILHAPPDPNTVFSNSSQDSEDAELSNIASMACRSGMASYNQNYDSQDSFGGDDDYHVPGDVKTKQDDAYTELANRGPSVLKLKLDPSSGYMKSSPVPQGPPPDYSTTEHSILKSHLLSHRLKPSNQWIISKSHVKDSDEQILFTNENLSVPGTSHVAGYANAEVAYDGNGVVYSPEVYSSENVHVEAVQPESYEPEYVIDRKQGLPDYSPTKSMSEYISNTKIIIDKKMGGNFANNSDPYSQVIGSDSGVVSESEEYRVVQDNGKTVIIQKNHLGYENNDNYVYYDENNRVQEYQIIHAKKKAKHDYNSPMYESIDHIKPPPSYESAVASNHPRRTDRQSRRRTDYIYDYEDIDEANLCIDEEPKPRKRKPKTEKSESKMSASGQMRNASFATPKNGIESLLQASAYTGSSDNQEREAVVGMLTISQSYGLAKEGREKKVEQVEAPPIRAVHRDQDFVYTSLDMSSDEEDEIAYNSRAPKRKLPFFSSTVNQSDKEDESWSPKGRLGRLTPRMNRPSRRSSKRESVQAALRAARNRGNSSDEEYHEPPSIDPGSVSPPSQYQYLQPTNDISLQPNQPYGSPKKGSRKKRPVKPSRLTPFQSNFSPTPKTQKHKKGMKTAKQRLSKILKIHKMLG